MSYLPKWAVVLGLLYATSCHRPEERQWSMGYWTGYNGDPESAFVWGGLTHIIHWNAVLQDANGNLSFLCSGGAYCTQSQFVTYARSIISLAHSHNVKVVLGLSDQFSDPFGPALTKNFNGYLSNIMAIVNGAGYDGVDINWEINQNWTQYASFLTALRASLGTTRTLSGTTYGENNSFWATQAGKGTVDRVSFLTYDMEGDGSPYSWFNSALYSDSCNCVLSWDLDRDRIMSAGVPASKLNMGIPFYGYLETGVNGPRQHGQSGASQLQYKDFVTHYNITTPAYDSVAHEPWIPVGPSSWSGFENARSVTEKVNYAKKHSLGGWVIFNLSADYIASPKPHHPLMAAVASAILTGSKAPNQ